VGAIVGNCGDFGVKISMGFSMEVGKTKVNRKVIFLFLVLLGGGVFISALGLRRHRRAH